MTRPLSISAIVLTKDRPDLLEECLVALLGEGLRPIVVANGSFEEGETAARLGAGEVILPSAPLSFSEGNNFAVRAYARVHDSEYLLLVNNDAFVRAGTVATMVRTAESLSAHIVGARLLYPTRLIQHVGLAFRSDRMPYYPYRGIPDGWQPRALQHDRICPAVTFALVLIRRDVWMALGGLDESFVFGYEDVDFCLRARAAGYRIAYSHAAVATHLEGATPGRYEYIADSVLRYQEKWCREEELPSGL